jgi:O-antigen ligase
MISILIICSVIYSAWKYPPITFALLLHIYLIRSLAEINIHDLCYSGECQLASNIIFGVLLPILSLVIIGIKVISTKKIKYAFDLFDVLVFLLTTMVIIGTNFSYDLNIGLEYSLKFVFLGVSYYYIAKLYFSSTQNLESDIKLFFLAQYFIGILLSTIALFLWIMYDDYVVQLTLPGIHPIPFALLLGVSFITAFVLSTTKGSVFSIQNKYLLFLNNLFMGYLLLLIFMTNVRGVLLITIIAIILYTLLNPKYIFKPKILIFFTGFILFIVLFVINIGVEKFFGRLLKSSEDQSISERVLAYSDSIEIFSNNIFGVGNYSFQFYSFLEYPHNMFMELIVNYGLFGLILDYLILAFVFLLLLRLLFYPKNYILILLFLMLIYFFIETMFSFTLWMHKGLYISMGMISVYKSYFNKYKVRNK